MEFLVFERIPIQGQNLAHFEGNTFVSGFLGREELLKINVIIANRKGGV